MPVVLRTFWANMIVAWTMHWMKSVERVSISSIDKWFQIRTPLNHMIAHEIVMLESATLIIVLLLPRFTAQIIFWNFVTAGSKLIYIKKYKIYFCIKIIIILTWPCLQFTLLCVRSLSCCKFVRRYCTLAYLHVADTTGFCRQSIPKFFDSWKNCCRESPD